MTTGLTISILFFALIFTLTAAKQVSVYKRRLKRIYSERIETLRVKSTNQAIQIEMLKDTLKRNSFNREAFISYKKDSQEEIFRLKEIINSQK